MNHNKKKYKRDDRKRKKKSKHKARRASRYTQAPEIVVEDAVNKNTKLYESVFSDEILPYV